MSQFRIGIVTNEKENLRLLFKELEARARPNLFRFYFWLSFASQRHLHVPSGTGDITSFGFLTDLARLTGSLQTLLVWEVSK